MAVGFGHKAWIGFAPESTYGTAVASTKFLEITSENFKGEQSRLVKPVLARTTQTRFVKSKKNVSGGFEAPFTFDGAELLLKHTLGSNTTTGVSPYTHTMSPSDALPTGLTFHVNRDAAAVGTGSSFYYEGCHINKLTLRQEMEEHLMMSFEVVGEDWGNENIETPTYPDIEYADYEMFALTPTGMTAAVVRSAELVIDNNLAVDRYDLGSRVRRSAGLGRAGHRKINGTLELEFDSLTDYAVYRDMTAGTQLVFAWTSGTKSLTITLPDCYIQGGDPEVSGPGPITWNVNFEAYHATANTEISLVLVNSVSSIA